MSEVTKENYLEELFIDEVKGALDAKGDASGGTGVQLYDLGEGTSWDVKALIESGTLPSTIDYTVLTEDNFIIEIAAFPAISSSNITKLSADSTYRITTSTTKPTKTYLAAMGTLSVSGGTITAILMTTAPSISQVSSKAGACTLKAYLIC